MPRSAWICTVEPTARSLRRTRDKYTSILLYANSLSGPHTLCCRVARGSTWPGCSRNNSRICISLPDRRTSPVWVRSMQCPRSSVRSPAVSRRGCSKGPRRLSARTREQFAHKKWSGQHIVSSGVKRKDPSRAGRWAAITRMGMEMPSSRSEVNSRERGSTTFLLLRPANRMNTS